MCIYDLFRKKKKKKLILIFIYKYKGLKKMERNVELQPHKK